MSGWIRIAASLCVILLAACQPAGQQALLDDYLTRILRVTGAEVDLPEAAPLPGYPPRRALTVEIPRRTIDVMEFFELHGCDMGALVGFRNSPLGRLQGASQRLGYETAWLAALDRCGAEAQAWLAEMGEEKRARLPALFWNATFAGDEMRVALGASSPRPEDDLADVLRGLNDSLTLLERGSFDLAALEGLLARLRQGGWVGPARRDWQDWRRYLGTASGALRTALPGICLNRQPTPRVRRLANVFMKLYVQQVQPVLARDLGRHQRWVAAQTQLSGRLSDVSPQAYQRWFGAVLDPDAPGSEWARTRRAVVAHVAAWQELFAHCNIEPIPGLGQD